MLLNSTIKGILLQICCILNKNLEMEVVVRGMSDFIVIGKVVKSDIHWKSLNIMDRETDSETNFGPEENTLEYLTLSEIQQKLRAKKMWQRNVPKQSNKGYENMDAKKDVPVKKDVPTKRRMFLW